MASIRTYAAIGHFKGSKNTTSVASDQTTKRAFTEECRGNSFVPYVVITETMFNRLNACKDSFEIYEVVKKMTSNYRVWDDVTDYLEQHIDIIKSKMNVVKAEQEQEIGETTLTDEEIKYFEDTVTKVKHSVNVRVPIEIMNHEHLIGKDKEALGICWAKDDGTKLVPFRITIDEFFVHECFAAIEKPYIGKLEPQSLEEVIAHEIAHLHYWRHGKKHTEFTRYICRLIEKGEPHGMKDGNMPTVSETGSELLVAMRPTLRRDK